MIGDIEDFIRKIRDATESVGEFSEAFDDMGDDISDEVAGEEDEQTETDEPGEESGVGSKKSSASRNLKRRAGFKGLKNVKKKGLRLKARARLARRKSMSRIGQVLGVRGLAKAGVAGVALYAGIKTAQTYASYRITVNDIQAANSPELAAAQVAEPYIADLAALSATERVTYNRFKSTMKASHGGRFSKLRAEARRGVHFSAEFIRDEFKRSINEEIGADTFNREVQTQMDSDINEDMRASGSVMKALIAHLANKVKEKR